MIVHRNRASSCFVKRAIGALALVTIVASVAWTADGVQEPQSIIAFLNQTIVWYRQLTVQEQLATDPSDVLFLDDNRSLADQIVRQSFDFARARAQALSAQGSATAPSGGQAQGRLQNLVAIVNKADQQVKELQGEIDTARRQLETATGKKRTSLEAVLAETQSEQQLQIARRDTMRSMLSFASGAGAGFGGNGSLESQIEELARTVPAAAAVTEKPGASGSTTPANEPSAKVQVTNGKKADEPNGILGLVTDLMALHRKSTAIEEAMASTDGMQATLKTMRAPLVAQVKQLVAQGDEIAAEPDATDPAILAQQKQRLDALTAQFKLVTASTLPLSKASILLDIYKRSLGNWRGSVESQYRDELKNLILRLVILGIVLGLIAAVSAIWKRATFRYVQDIRRRYQFLLLRRIVVWIVVAIVIAAAFATELGTLATFAGLLTAGVAVALQNVILSVAGYFFLIGKYGVRVGDRVQIAGVTGDVIDIGLVRLHIMEVATDTADPRATGRVVVFSNAVVFQPNAGLFKQIPGTNFRWHEISLTVAADSNYHAVEERMMAAVNSVYEKLKESMEVQRRRMERELSGISVRSFQPESRVRWTQTGLEVVIRYPVDLSSVAQIDDDMARAMLDAISKEPRLKLVGSGTPNIQPVVEGKPA